MGGVDRTGRRATVAAALAGFSCMAAELTAVRLLAPHFGDSAYVWTNVIGVILAALALGALLGGRLSAGANVTGRAGWLLGGAAAWLGLAPLVAPALGGWLLPAALPLDAAMPALVRGSFVATVVLFGPAMLLLGAISPLLVTWVVRGGQDVGRAAGRIAAAGTLGSLAGTFVATHWLVPSFGCRIAMLVAGSLLAVAAWLVVANGRARAAATVLVAMIGGSFALHHGPLRPPPDGSELLAERESRTQFLQVLRTTETPARTSLVINEGLDSFHSLAVAGSVFTGGAYYDWHALAPLLVDGVQTAELRTLSIGDAAGTLRAVYAGVHAGARVDAVDIDGAAMELGDALFPGPKAEGARFVVDGRVFVEAASARWHVIHVDAYAHQVYVPAHLASREFFAAARRRLLPGGVIACNVGALRQDDPVLRAIAATMREVFGHARALLIPNQRNALLVARNGEPPAAPAATSAAAATALSPADREHWAAILRTASSPQGWIDVSGGELLSDDVPMLDQLLAHSYIASNDDGALVPCNGSTDVAGAEAAAYRARQDRDWLAVLAAVAASDAASAFLRELAGDARWSLRQLRAAGAEYEAGIALAADATTRARLTSKRDDVAAQRVPIAEAERVGARNGWLRIAVIAIVAAALLLSALRRVPVRERGRAQPSLPSPS